MISYCFTINWILLAKEWTDDNDKWIHKAKNGYIIIKIPGSLMLQISQDSALINGPLILTTIVDLQNKMLIIIILYTSRGRRRERGVWFDSVTLVS